MPVFDFSGASASKAEAKCTYTVFYSNHLQPSADRPILVLDNKKDSGNIIPVVFLPIQ